MKTYGSRREIRRVISTVIAVAFASVMLMTGVCEVYGATTYSYTCSKSKTNGGTKFSVPDLKLTGVCCQHNVSMKKGKAKFTKQSNSSDYAKVAYYWGVVKGYDKSGLDSNNRQKLTRMMQYISDPKGTSGLYYVKYGTCKQDIKKARSVTVPNTFVIYKGNPTNNSQDFMAWRNESPISLTLVKKSSDPGFSALGGYDFSGISYQVYKSDKKTAVGVLTCKSDGTTNTLTGLEKGTYYARERTSNKYYSYNGNWIGVTVGEGGKGTFNATDTPLKGKVRIRKGSTDPSSVNAGYNFSGIVYGVYASASIGSKLLAELHLDASGASGVSADLPIGTKYIREIRTNSFYEKSDTWYPITVTAGKTTELGANTIKDRPVTGTLSVVKKIEGGEAADQEFVFELINRKNSSIAYRNIKVKGDGTPTNLNVLAGDYIMRETDTGDYMDETGEQEVTIKGGETLKIERVNRIASPGSLQVRKLTDDGGKKEGFRFVVSGSLRNQAILTEEQLLAEADPRISLGSDDVEYTLGKWEVDGEGLQALNKAAEEHKTGEFTVKMTNRITLPETTEETTAEAGEETTTETTTEAPGGNTIEAPTEAGEGTTTETTKESSSESGGEEERTTMKEVDLTAEVMIKLSQVYWDSENRNYEGRAVGHSETKLAGKDCDIVVRDFEWCGAATGYRDPDTGADHTILITNSRGYGINENTGEEGVDPAFAGEYTVEEVMTEDQKLRYREAGKQTLSWNGEGKGNLSFTFVNRAKTVPVRLKKTSIDGKVEGIDFCLSGKTAFGETVRKTGRTDSSGNIDFGVLHKGNYVIEETGWDETKYSNSHKLDGYDRPAVAVEVRGDETEDIVVSFENVPYGNLRITKTDKDTGEFLPGASFSIVNTTKNRVEATFRLVDENGYPRAEMAEPVSQIKAVETTRSSADTEDTWLEFTGLTSGDEYSVVEVDAPLGYGVEKTAKEFKADHDNEAELKFEDARSRIGTTAVDSETGEHVALADENVTIIDTVRYEDLIPGKEYRLLGTLMDKSAYLLSNDIADVTPAKDASGRPITAEIRFTPKTAVGTVRVPFSFDGSTLGGSTLVVYEKLFIGDDPVTSHEDPTDRDQTVEMPGIKTTATSEETKMHIDNGDSDVIINDLVAYSNLAVGVPYHLSGVLMDKSTGRPVTVGGSEIRSELDFTPEESSGTVTISFRFNGEELAGTGLVAFEELECKGKIVAEHKDISDPSQTVDIPKLGTVAERPSKNRIEDRVTYEGLIPGEKYVMCGVLVDKETGTELEETRSEKEFTPEKSSGTMVIPFSISADGLLERGIEDVVVFERCDLVIDLEGEGNPVPVEIASHRDINDRNQLVALLKPTKKTHTGDDARLILSVCLALLTGSLAGVVHMLRRRRHLHRIG